MKLLNKVKISLLIVFLVGLLSGIKAFAVTGVITEITVNLRKEPSTNSKKIMYVTQDDVVEVLEKDGEWYKIKFEGKTGYVFGKYIKVDDTKLEEKEETNSKEQEESKDTENKNSNDIQDVTTDGILKLKIASKTQIRLIPNISSNVIYISKKDISVEVIKQLGNWTYIFVDNLYGWVRTDKVVEENETTTTKEETDSIKDKAETASQETKLAYIKYDTVNVRKKASTSSSILTKLKLNDEVTVLEKVDSKWSKIKFNGQVGYISTELLADEKQKGAQKEETNTTKEDTTKKEETTKTAYIKYDTVNVRKKASTSSSILAKLKLNDEVTVLEKVDSKWSKIKFDEQVGYISTELLADEKQKVTQKEETNTTSRDGETTSREESTVNKQEEKSEAENNKVDTSKKEENKETTSKKVTGADIVAYAKKYLGYDYVYGGASPKTGFDCSGLTQYVYKHFGYTLSRSSTAQAKNGKEVSKKDLQPGDLLIFKNQSLTRIGHVGIYIGNNKMIHASEPGIGVVITDLDAKGYNYNKRYVTARRII